MNIPRLVVASLICGFVPLLHAQEQTAEVVKYLGDHAIPLKSVQAGSGFDDLKPLKKILKDTRIVGLGEGTHGTREFFQFKHRMLEFLVKEMGFNVFTLEASYIGCLNINDYVMYGKGDPAAALASQGFWTWDTEEVRDMIQWLREYNSKLPEEKRVQFLGYDIQVFDAAFPLLEDYFKRVAPDYLPTAQAAFEPMKLKAPGAREAFDKRTREERVAQAAGLKNVMDMMEKNREAFIKQASQDEFDRMFHHVLVVYQYQDAYSKRDQGESHGGSRDRYMAENIRYFMDKLGPKTKMAVWAHNAHVSNSAEYSGGAMGHYLREWYGPRYYILGFAFNEGAFQSMGRAGAGQIGGLQEFTLPPATEGTVAWYLEQARQARGLKDYIVDFRSAPGTGPVAEWMATRRGLTSVGSMFSVNGPPGQFMMEVPPGKDFDGLVFVEKTTRARPNPSGMRPPPATATERK